MPSSWTPSLRLNKQFPGENISLWGDYLNDQVFTPVDYAIAGWLTKAITGDYVLTTANGSPDEARAAMLKFTGSLAANSSITIPSVSKSYFAYNATDKALTFTTGAGATVTVDAGDKTVIDCDGSGVHTISFGGYGLKDYIAAQVLASSAALPGQVGNAGKFIKTDGAAATWQQIQSADIGDFNAEIRRRVLVYSLIFKR